MRAVKFFPIDCQIHTQHIAGGRIGDVLSRVPAHRITRLTELLPHNWKSTTCPAQA